MKLVNIAVMVAISMGMVSCGGGGSTSTADEQVPVSQLVPSLVASPFEVVTEVEVPVVEVPVAVQEEEVIVVDVPSTPVEAPVSPSEPEVIPTPVVVPESPVDEPTEPPIVVVVVEEVVDIVVEPISPEPDLDNNEIPFLDKPTVVGSYTIFTASSAGDFPSECTLEITDTYCGVWDYIEIKFQIVITPVEAAVGYGVYYNGISEDLIVANSPPYDLDAYVYTSVHLIAPSGDALTDRTNIELRINNSKYEVDAWDTYGNSSGFTLVTWSNAQ